MIYSEQITCDALPGEKEFYIERQRNKPTESWYGLIIGLYNPVGQDFIVAEDERWIRLLPESSSKNLSDMLSKTNCDGLSYTKDDAKHIKKLIKKVQTLGWL